MKNFETNDLAFSPKENFGDNSGLATYVTKSIDPSISWEDIKWLRGLTSLPIVAKGILRGLYISHTDLMILCSYMIVTCLRENNQEQLTWKSKETFHLSTLAIDFSE